jgi:hypothetical protein
MLDDRGKLEQYRGVVEDLVAAEMSRLRAYAEFVSQNTLYRGKRIEYTPRIGAVRAPALLEEFVARCAAEGFDVRLGASYGRCVLRVRVVGRDEGKRDQRDRREHGAQKPDAGVQSPGREPGGRPDVLKGPVARPELAEI